MTPLGENEGGGASHSTEIAHGTSSATDVSLREFLEQRADYEREITNLQFELRDKARELQAVEYERRLEALNHENARVQESQEKSVTQDKFDALTDKFAEYVARTEAESKLTEGRAAGQERILGTANQGVLLLVAIAGMILVLVRSFN